MFQGRILTAVLASAAFISVAHAADLGMRAPLPAPAFTWAGLYIGANIGGSFSNSNSTDYTYVDPNECGDIACDIPSSTLLGLGSGKNSGVVGGVQAGYNWQANSVVFGLEADIDFGERTTHHGFYARVNCEITDCASGPDGYDHFLSNANGGGDFGTLRARLGWAIDHTLIYVTGGLAVGEQSKVSITDYRLLGTSTELSSYSGIPGDTFISNNNGVRIGYAVGGGLEYALNDSWSVKAEYLYVNLDGNNHGGNRFLEWSGPDFGPTPGNIGYITASHQNDSFNVVRVGLNYKFGAPLPPAPVVRAY